MTKHCFTMELYPGCEAEYEKLHNEMPSELVADTISAGYKSYSIWRNGLQLFVYFECADLETAKSKDAVSIAGLEWGKIFQRLVKIDVDPRTKFPYLLPCVWDLHDAS